MASMIRRRFVRIQSRSIPHPIECPLPVHTRGQVVGVSRVGVGIRKGQGIDGLPIHHIGAPLDLVWLVRHGVPTKADLAGGDVGDFDRRASPRSEDEAVADVAIAAAGGFVVEDAGGIRWHRVGARTVTADVIGNAVVRADGNADVAAVGKELAGTVGSKINVLAVSGTAETGVVRGARLRALEIDDAVLGLVAIKMVVAMEDDVDLVHHKQIMNGHIPTGALGSKACSAVDVVAAPLVFVTHFNTAACSELRCRHAIDNGLRAAPDDVVHEDKLVFGTAVFERVAQPVVLRLTKGPVPRIVGGVRIRHGVPEGIEHDEQGLTPLEGIVVFEQAERAAGVVLRCWVAVEEGIGRRCRVEGFAGLQVPRGDVVLLVGSGSKEVAVFRLVIAEAKEERDAVAGALEGIAEDDRAVVDGRLVDGDTTAPLWRNAEQAVGKLIGHEDVAHVHVEIGRIETDVLHRTPEELHVGVHVDMWIRGDSEAERGATWPCGVEAALTAGFVENGTDIAMTNAVVILGVWLQTSDRDANRVFELRLGAVDIESRGCGRKRVFTGLRAVFNEDLLIDRGDQIQCHAVGFWQGEELRAKDGSVREQVVHCIDVVATARAGGTGVRVVRGHDFEVDRGATGLSGDLSAPDAVIGRAVAVIAIVKHGECDGRRRCSGGDENVVNADAW